MFYSRSFDNFLRLSPPHTWLAAQLEILDRTLETGPTAPDGLQQLTISHLCLQHSFVTDQILTQRQARASLRLSTWQGTKMVG
jgi:hypothetical protein